MRREPRRSRPSAERPAPRGVDTGPRAPPRGARQVFQPNWMVVLQQASYTESGAEREPRLSSFRNVTACYERTREHHFVATPQTCSACKLHTSGASGVARNRRKKPVTTTS